MDGLAPTGRNFQHRRLLITSGLVLNWLIRHGCRAELGLHFTGIGLGIVVSGLAVAAMASLDWAGQWLGLGVLGLVFMLPAWWWMPCASRGRRHRHNAGRRASRRWMGFCGGVFFVAGFGYVISATFIIAIVGKLPLLANLGGWVWVLVGLMATPSCFVWDRLAARLGRFGAFAGLWPLQTVSIALPAASEGALLNLLSAALYGGTFVGIVSLTLSIIGRHFPANPAKAMARDAQLWRGADCGAGAGWLYRHRHRQLSRRAVAGGGGDAGRHGGAWRPCGKNPLTALDKANKPAVHYHPQRRFELPACGRFTNAAKRMRNLHSFGWRVFVCRPARQRRFNAHNLQALDKSC